MADEKNEFRVVDRRHSATSETEETPAKKEPPKTAQGEGFTMKEGEKPSEPHQLDFSTLVFSLATGALIHMGLAPDPMSKRAEKNLELAKQNIDILEILKDKTRGNLSPEELKLLENLLTETQLRFVEASR